MAHVITRRIGRSFIKCYKTFSFTTLQPCTSFFITKLDTTVQHCNFCCNNFNQKTILIRTQGIKHLQFYSTENKHSRNECEAPKEDTKNLTLFQRFKQMYRDYWYVLVPVHLVTSAAWFGGFYYLATSGVDIPGWLESLQFSEKIVNSMRDSSMGYFAVSYALYKIATPARYTVTLGGTTLSIQYLTKWGYIKPVPSKERLVEILQETKEGIKEKKDSIIETVKEKKGTVLETVKEKKDSVLETVKETTEEVKLKKDKLLGTSQENQKNKTSKSVRIKDKIKKF